MKKNCLVSIVVPIYNVDEYLKKCVDSIRMQSYKDLQIILVDDGSTDNSSILCDDYSKIDGRIEVIHKENGGLSDARNQGILTSVGKYICFIDGDDWIDTHMIENLVNVAENDNSDVVSCGIRWIYDDGTVIRENTSEKKCILNNSAGYLEILKDDILKQHVCNKLYKTEIVKLIPFEKGKCHEDVIWSYQLFAKANITSIVPEVYYNYVQRNNSIMGQIYSEKRLDALDAKYDRCNFTKMHYSNYVDVAVYDYTISCMYHLQTAIIQKCDKTIINNIKNRVNYCKQYKIINIAKGKQKVWIKAFLLNPILTCKIRNKLKIGL